LHFSFFNFHFSLIDFPPSLAPRDAFETNAPRLTTPPSQRLLLRHKTNKKDAAQPPQQPTAHLIHCSPDLF
jgi:hypothetical protein